MRIVAWLVLAFLLAVVACGIEYVPRHEGSPSLVIGLVLLPSFAVCWCMSKIIPQPDKKAASVDPHAGKPQETPAVPRRFLVAITVTMATFMEVLDSSIANVSLPYIAGDLGVSVDDASWILTTYLVANAIVLPLSGWLSNLIGRKRFYMTCVALFTISSILCGLAPNLNMLLLFRIFQGIGGGGLQPSEQGILIDTFPGKSRGMAMTIYGVAILVAPILGPTLGGYITQNSNWRWIFFINIPVGILSLFLTGILVHDPPYMEERRKARKGMALNIDYVGLGLIAVGFAALEIVYDRGQEDDWFNSQAIIGLIVLSVICIGTAIVWELRHPNPIINFGLLRERNFAACCAVIFVVFAALYGSNVLLPQLVQQLYGYDAYTAGLLMSPGGVAVMLCMPPVGIMLGKGVAPRYLILFGVMAVAVASYWSAFLTLDASPYVLVVHRCAQVFGMAFIFAPVNTAAYANLPKDQVNNATGLYNLIRNEGSSLGIALVNTVLARRGQFHQTRLTENLDPFNPAMATATDQSTAAFQSAGYDPVAAAQMALGQVYDQVIMQSQALAYFDLFALFGIAAFCAVPLVLLMKSVDPKKAGEVPVH